MFSDNKKIVDSKIDDIDLEDLKCMKFHKCWCCGQRYSYIPCVTYDNDYSDYEDDLYYKCPTCGTKWHVPDNIVNFISCFIKNIIEKFQDMSRTRKKYIKLGNCSGNNTQYYRQRRKTENAKNKHILSNACRKYDGDEIDEYVYNMKLPHDSWNEPTDGTHIVDYKIAKEKYNCFPDFLKRKLLPKLKKTKKSKRI